MFKNRVDRIIVEIKFCVLLILLYLLGTSKRFLYQHVCTKKSGVFLDMKLPIVEAVFLDRRMKLTGFEQTKLPNLNPISDNRTLYPLILFSKRLDK